MKEGHNVTLIPPLEIKGMDNPDIEINGTIWEIKSPTGDGKYTMKHTLENAKHQSRYVIVDLRRCKMLESKAIKELEHHFQLSKRLKGMIIISKSEKMLDYKK